jgi:hypothetical protein
MEVNIGPTSGKSFVSRESTLPAEWQNAGRRSGAFLHKDPLGKVHGKIRREDCPVPYRVRALNAGLLVAHHRNAFFQTSYSFPKLKVFPLTPVIADSRLEIVEFSFVQNLISHLEHLTGILPSSFGFRFLHNPAILVLTPVASISGSVLKPASP